MFLSDGIELSTGERLEVFSNGSLIIKSVANADAGGYTCTATNRRGLSSARTAIVKVIGKCRILRGVLITIDYQISVPPKLQNFGNSHQTLQVDQKITMLCSITEGDEPITLSWQKDGVLLLESGSEGIVITKMDHLSILRINSLEAHHMGNYSCHASNQAGSTVIYSFLQVKGMC